MKTYETLSVLFLSGTAVVFIRYMMLSLENWESNDDRSLGELFLCFFDEIL